MKAHWRGALTEMQGGAEQLAPKHASQALPPGMLARLPGPVAEHPAL